MFGDGNLAFAEKGISPRAPVQHVANVLRNVVETVEWKVYFLPFFLL